MFQTARMAWSALRKGSIAAMAIAAVSLPNGAAAQNIETEAAQAMLVDHETGTVLFSKNADEPVPPASLTKLMTMELLFDAVQRGEIGLDDQMVTSEYAWRTGGAPSNSSAMFLRPNESASVSNLMRGVIVQSGNDAAITIAENMGGSESNFASMMNERAAALGLDDSHFVNASGLPAEGQVVTMDDLIALARHIYQAYPEFYPIYSEQEFTWSGITQRNRNPVLGDGLGVDGMKTGYIDASGYALVASAQQNGRRLFLAMSGLPSIRAREAEARKLLQYGFGAFDRRQIAAADEPIADVALYGGQINRLPLRSSGPVTLLIPRGNRASLRAEIVYDGPVVAPVQEGDQVGTLEVYMGDTLSAQTPLYAAETVEQGSLPSRAMDAFEELTLGWLRG